MRSNISVIDIEELDEPVQLAVANDITEQVEASQRFHRIPISDEALLIQQTLPTALETMMASQIEITFVKDRKLRYVCCSRAFARMVGLKNERDIAGKTVHDLFDEEVADKYTADDLRLIQSGESIVDQEETIQLKDGTVLHISHSKYILRDSHGEMIGIYGVGLDITKAREKDSQLRLLTNSIPGGIATYEYSSGKLRITYFNDGFCKLFEQTREECEALSAENAMIGVLEEDMPILEEQLEGLIHKNTQLNCTCRVRLESGQVKWIDMRAAATGRRGDGMTFSMVLFDVTERQSSMEKLRINEEENRLAILHSGNIVCRYSIAERTLTASPEAAAKLNRPERIEDVPYGPASIGKIAPESVETYIAFFEEIMHGKESGSAVFRSEITGSWRWLEAHYSTIFSNIGEPVSAVISFNDVTEQLEKEAVYRKWQQSLSNRKPDEYTLFRCNISKNTSFDSKEGSLLDISFKESSLTFDQRTAEYVEQRVYEEDAERYAAFLKSDMMLAKYYRGNRSATLEYREKLDEGGYRWLRLTVDLVEYPNSADIEAYLMYENIDETKRAELETSLRAETDPLTATFNRVAFASRVESVLGAAKPGVRYALIMLDIDGFKLVNDAFGHGIGDQALIEIADSLKSVIRRDDMLGRLGGDEFLVLLGDIPNDGAVENNAKRMCAMIRKSFSAEVQISASIGVSVFPRDGSDFETLYRKADAALYHVKESGKNNYAFYHDDMNDDEIGSGQDDGYTGMREQKNKRRMLIVDDSNIDHALLDNIFKEEFVIETAADGNEALLRLRHYGTAISVILLDLLMPGMDGFAVLNKIQCSHELRSIPVIVVSGAEDHETNLRAIRGGAADFVTKPVDPDILRIRVRSAISKAENEKLRAQNSFLELQNNETLRYKTALEGAGICVIEYDRTSGLFLYDPSISKYVAGNYDERELWDILLSDEVAGAEDVRRMRRLMLSFEKDASLMEGSLEMELCTPQGDRRSFRMHMRKPGRKSQLSDKLIFTLIDLEG